MKIFIRISLLISIMVVSSVVLFNTSPLTFMYLQLGALIFIWALCVVYLVMVIAKKIFDL